MACTCNPSAQEAEEGGLLAGGQPDLHSDCLKQNRKLEQREKNLLPGEDLNLMLVPEYSSMLIEMLCYQENRFFILPFVALIIIFLVYHKLICLFCCCLGFLFVQDVFSVVVFSLYVSSHLPSLLGKPRAHLTYSFLWLSDFTGGRRLLFPNGHISFWFVWHVVESTLYLLNILKMELCTECRDFICMLLLWCCSGSLTGSPQPVLPSARWDQLTIQLTAAGFL